MSEWVICVESPPRNRVAVIHQNAGIIDAKMQKGRKIKSGQRREMPWPAIHQILHASHAAAAPLAACACPNMQISLMPFRKELPTPTPFPCHAGLWPNLGHVKNLHQCVGSGVVDQAQHFVTFLFVSSLHMLMSPPACPRGSHPQFGTFDDSLKLFYLILIQHRRASSFHLSHLPFCCDERR